jgi:hypothetical protein
MSSHSDPNHQSFPTFRAKLARVHVREAVPIALRWLILGGAQIALFDSRAVQLLTSSMTWAMSPFFKTMVTTNPRLLERNLGRLTKVVQTELLRVPAGAFRIMGDRSLSQTQRATRVAAQVIQPVVVNVLLLTPPSTLAAIAGLSVLGLGVTLLEDPKDENPVFRAGGKIVGFVGATAGTAFLAKTGLGLITPTNAPFVAGTMQFYVASSLTSNVATSALSHITDGYITDFKLGSSLLRTLLDTLDRDITVVRFRQHIRRRVDAAGKRAAKMHDQTWRRHVSPHLPSFLQPISVAFMAKFTAAFGLLFVYASIPYHLDVLRHELKWAQPLWETVSRLVHDTTTGTFGPFFQSQAISWMYTTRVASVLEAIGHSVSKSARNSFYYAIWYPFVRQLMQDTLGIDRFVKVQVSKSIRMLKDHHEWLAMLLTHKPFKAVLTTELANRWRLQYLLDTSVEHLFVHSPLSAFLSIATDPYVGAPQRAVEYLSDHATAPLVQSMRAAWDSRADVFVTVQQALWQSGPVQVASTEPLSSDQVMNTLAKSFVNTLERPVDTAWMEVHEAFEEYTSRVAGTTTPPNTNHGGGGGGGGGGEAHAPRTPLGDTRNRIQQQVQELQRHLASAQLAQAEHNAAQPSLSQKPSPSPPASVRHFLKDAHHIHNSITAELRDLDTQAAHAQRHEAILWRDRTNRESKRKYLVEICDMFHTLRSATVRHPTTEPSVEDAAQQQRHSPESIVQDIRDDELDKYVSLKDLRRCRESYNSVRRQVLQWTELAKKAASLHTPHLSPELATQLRRTEQLVHLVTNHPHAAERASSNSRLSALRLLRSAHNHQQNMQLLDLLLQDVSTQVNLASREQKVSIECEQLVRELNTRLAANAAAAAANKPSDHLPHTRPVDHPNNRPPQQTLRTLLSLPKDMAQREALVHLHRHILSGSDVRKLVTHMPHVPHGHALSYDDIRKALTSQQRHELDIAMHDLRTYWDSTDHERRSLRRKTEAAYSDRFYTKMGQLRRLKALTNVSLPQRISNLKKVKQRLLAKRAALQTEHDRSLFFYAPESYSFSGSAADVMQLSDARGWFDDNIKALGSADAEGRWMRGSYKEAYDQLSTTASPIADVKGLVTMAELDHNTELLKDIHTAVDKYYTTRDGALGNAHDEVLRGIRGLYVEQASQNLNALVHRAQQHSWFGRQPQHLETLRQAMVEHKRNAFQLLTTAPTSLLPNHRHQLPTAGDRDGGDGKEHQPGVAQAATVAEPQSLERTDVAEWAALCGAIGVDTVDRHVQGLLNYVESLSRAQQLLNRESARVIDKAVVDVMSSSSTNQLAATTETCTRMDDPPSPQHIQEALRTWEAEMDRLHDLTKQHPDRLTVYDPILSNLNTLQTARTNVHHQYQTLLHRLTIECAANRRGISPSSERTAGNVPHVPPDTEAAVHRRQRLHADIRALQKHIRDMYSPQQLLSSPSIRSSTHGLNTAQDNPFLTNHRKPLTEKEGGVSSVTPDQALLTTVRKELYEPGQSIRNRDGSTWLRPSTAVHERLGTMARLLELHNQADQLIHQQQHLDGEVEKAARTAGDDGTFQLQDLAKQQAALTQEAHALDGSINSFLQATTTRDVLDQSFLSNLHNKQRVLSGLMDDRRQDADRDRDVHTQKLLSVNTALERLEQQLHRPFRYMPNTPSVQQWTQHLSKPVSTFTSWSGSSLFVAQPTSRTAQRSQAARELGMRLAEAQHRVHMLAADTSSLHSITMQAQARADVGASVAQLNVLQDRYHTVLRALLQDSLQDWTSLHAHVHQLLDSGQVAMYQNGVAVHEDQARAVAELMQKSGAGVLEQEAASLVKDLTSPATPTPSSSTIDGQRTSAQHMFNTARQAVQGETERMQSTLGEKWAQHLRTEQARVLKQARTRQKLLAALENVQQRWKESVETTATAVTNTEPATAPPTTQSELIAELNSAQGRQRVSELNQKWGAYQNTIRSYQKELRHLNHELTKAEEHSVLPKHSLIRDTLTRLEQTIAAQHTRTITPLLQAYVEHQLVIPSASLVKEASALLSTLRAGDLAWYTEEERRLLQERTHTLRSAADRMQHDYKALMRVSQDQSALSTQMREANRSGIRKVERHLSSLTRLVQSLEEEEDDNQQSQKGNMGVLELPRGTRQRIEQLSAFDAVNRVMHAQSTATEKKTTTPTFATTSELRTWLHRTLRVSREVHAHTMSEADFERRFADGVKTRFRDNPFEPELSRLVAARSVGLLTTVMGSKEIQASLHLTKWSSPAHLHQQLMNPSQTTALQTLAHRMAEYRKVAQQMGPDYKKAAKKGGRHDSIEARHLDWLDWSTLLGRQRQHHNSVANIKSEYISDHTEAARRIAYSTPLHAEKILSSVSNPVQAHLLLGALHRVRDGGTISDPSLDAYALDTRVGDLELYQFLRTFDQNMHTIDASLPETRAQFDWNTVLYGVCTRALAGTFGEGEPVVVVPPNPNHGETTDIPLTAPEVSRIKQVLGTPGVRAALLAVGRRELVDAANQMGAALQQLPLEVLYGDNREYWDAGSTNNIIHFNRVSSKGHTFLAGRPDSSYWNTQHS